MAVWVSDLLPLVDFVGLMAGPAWLLLVDHPRLVTGALAVPAADGWWSQALLGAVLAAFILYDAGFGTAAASRRSPGLWLRPHGLRWIGLAAILTVIALGSPAWPSLPQHWLLLWLASGFAVSVGARLLAARLLSPADLPNRTVTATPSTLYRAVGYLGDGVQVGLLAQRPIRRWDGALKAAEDRLLGGLISLLLLPVLLLIALAIKLDGPGPVLFKQRRHRLDNGEFEIYKFRTMKWQSAASPEGLRQTSRHDPRVTRVGRLLRASSLDELPQLLNVLQGDMSLVGPRPHATDMRTSNQLGSDIVAAYAHRHRVKPGITGWAQVNGSRGATDTAAQLQRRVELDLHYIEHWSLWLDLKILALTAGTVIRGTNAF